MNLGNLRDLSLIYFILIAIAVGLAPGAAMLFAIKGLRILKRRGLPYVHLVQFYFRRIERLTLRVSRWVASPFIFAAAAAARVESTAARIEKLFARKEAS